MRIIFQCFIFIVLSSRSMAPISSQKINGVSLSNANSLYLAYHEGHGGFKRKTYNKKPWLKDVAKKVAARTSTYSKQLKKCESRLQKTKGFSLWPF